MKPNDEQTELMLRKLLITIATLAILLGVLVLHAGSWDNFKLRYFFLTQYFTDQTAELGDLAASNITPEQYSRIDLAELRNGGPGKDGIPSIDNPKFDTAATTPFGGDEIVIGIEVNGETKAYPYGILNWHEIVNDTVGGVNLTVSLCPLCDTISAFERGETTFGVSGKLYQSCLVMYDRADDTLYSQPWLIGIVGPSVNKSLQHVPVVKTTLGAWIAQYPNSQILSTKTGYRRDYFRYPYGSYYTDERIIFPARGQDQRTLPAKEIISYIWEADDTTPQDRFGGASIELVHSDLKKLGEKTLDWQGRQIRAYWDSELSTVRVTELDGTPLVSSTAFAFVYPAFFGD